MRAVWRLVGRRLRWRRKPAFLKTSLWLRRIVESVSKGAVLQGPFAGMRYDVEEPGPSYMPQLLGTYEMELNEIVEELLKQRFDLLINVGSSAGYFTVGLAMRTKRRVIAYEAEPKNHTKLQRLAEANGVGALIEQKGFCNPADLEADLAAADRALVVMDTDGGEDPLLDPQAVPALAKATILVETHDFLVPNITAELVRRFEKTHQIEKTMTRPRSTGDLPKAVPVLVRPFLKTAMREHRGIQQPFLLMTPLGG